MMICNGVRTQITHFRILPISPLIFAPVQKFALDYLRDQQILTPPCEWGWVVVVPLLGTTLEVEDSPGMVCCGCHSAASWCVVWARLGPRVVCNAIFSLHFAGPILPGNISVRAWNLFVLTLDLLKLLKLNTKYCNLILILHMPTVVLGVYYSASF